MVSEEVLLYVRAYVQSLSPRDDSILDQSPRILHMDGIYIHMYVCTYVCTYAYIHMYIYIYQHKNVHTFVRMTYICVYILLYYHNGQYIDISSQYESITDNTMVY